MLNGLHARKPARNRQTAHQPSANRRPLNPVANALMCAGNNPVTKLSVRKVTVISALLRAMAKPVRVPKCAVMPLVVLARKAPALPPKAKAVRRNRRCDAKVIARPVALRVKAIASANHPVVPVMVKALLVPRCAAMVSPRRVLPATGNAPR